MSEIQPPPIEEPEIERLPRPPEAQQGRFTKERRKKALVIAIVADAVQWIALPVFMWGGASPMNDVLDVVVGLVMIRLIGFHWALLPAFIAELVPFVDLVPSWTVAVWIATREWR